MSFFDRFKKQKEPGPGEELGDVLWFYTVPEEEPGLQNRLRAWKLNGGHAVFRVKIDDAARAVSVFMDDDYVGQPYEDVKTWLSWHVEDIVGISSAVARGGGHYQDGSPRPFHMAVAVKLKEPMIHPGRRGEPLRPARAAFGLPGDRVCVLSGTGKIHTCPPGCGIGDAGLQRYLLDDLNETQHSLCLKCYKDYF